MIPTLAADDEVLVDTRAYKQRLPDVGEIVVAHRPDRQEVILIKRVAGALPDGPILFWNTYNSVALAPPTLESR